MRREGSGTVLQTDLHSVRRLFNGFAIAASVHKQSDRHVFLPRHQGNHLVTDARRYRPPAAGSSGMQGRKRVVHEQASSRYRN